MNDEKRYTIDELTALTGFSRRTIRFYVERGLVEPPAGRGMGGFYGGSQLQALRRIAQARKEGRSLASIARSGERARPPLSMPASAPETILRWVLAPGLHIEATQIAVDNHGELLAALLELAGLVECPKPCGKFQAKPPTGRL